MRKELATLIMALGLIAGVAVVSYAQESKGVQPDNGKPAVTIPAVTTAAISANSSPLDLARSALAAQGGDKFKNLKSMVLIGSVDLYPPNSAQSIPGKFAIVVAGDRVRVDISAPPAISFKQVFD